MLTESYFQTLFQELGCDLSSPGACAWGQLGASGPGRGWWARDDRPTHLVWKFCTLTLRYGAVFRWHHRSKPSLAEVSWWGQAVLAGEGSRPAL